MKLGLLILAAILVLNYISSQAKYEPKVESTDDNSHSSLLWIATVYDDEIVFRFDNQEIYSVRFEPLDRHVKSRSFNIITGSINPILVTQWRTGAREKVLIIDPRLKKIQLEVESDGDIFFDVTDDNRILVEYLVINTDDSESTTQEDKIVEWPDLSKL